MKACPKCHSQIPLAATRCPKCGVDFSDDDMRAGNAAFKARRIRMLIAVGIAAVAFYFWVVSGGLEAVMNR